MNVLRDRIERWFMQRRRRGWNLPEEIMPADVEDADSLMTELGFHERQEELWPPEGADENVAEHLARQIIRLEVLICKHLGRDWRPTGMSLKTLLDDIRSISEERDHWKRQAADTVASNNRLLERARAAEAALEPFGSAYLKADRTSVGWQRDMRKKPELVHYVQAALITGTPEERAAIEAREAARAGARADRS